MNQGTCQQWAWYISVFSGICWKGCSFWTLRKLNRLPKSSRQHSNRKHLDTFLVWHQLPVLQKSQWGEIFLSKGDQRCVGGSCHLGKTVSKLPVPPCASSTYNSSDTVLCHLCLWTFILVGVAQFFQEEFFLSNSSWNILDKRVLFHFPQRSSKLVVTMCSSRGAEITINTGRWINFIKLKVHFFIWSQICDWEIISIVKNHWNYRMGC